MRIAVTGATGLIGGHVVAFLRERGHAVTVLTRDPAKARERLAGVDAVAWSRPESEPAPSGALAGRDAVVHLAGENVGQRWTREVKRRVLASRELGTRNLVAGMRAADPAPGALVSASGAGFYGFRGDERLPESASAGDDFLARVCVAWEREAMEFEGRVVTVRTGVALAPSGGALARMLPFFKAGIGGPVAGGRQYVPWIHVSDLAAIYVRAAEDAGWSGPVNGAAPEPVPNRELSKALGRVLRRPAVAPVPKLGVRALYGEMADIVIHGQRAVPERTLALGHEFRHAELEPALRDALGRG